jgi:alpha-L-rhamnosidase
MLTEALTNAELVIFADTRYEVWLDGAWLGRGPARFSRTLREYDVYSLDTLLPGEHLVSALVQWAPNVRRSESTTPFLLGHLKGVTPSGESVIIRTGPDWKVLLSDAWRQDAAPVHAWNLIGPTELLDLRRLPPDWMQPGYTDTTWSAAMVVSAPSLTFRPRSINFLSSVPVTVTALAVCRRTQFGRQI